MGDLMRMTSKEANGATVAKAVRSLCTFQQHHLEEYEHCDILLHRGFRVTWDIASFAETVLMRAAIMAIQTKDACVWEAISEYHEHRKRDKKIEIKVPEGKAPRTYQLDAAKVWLEKNHVGMQMDVGAGKTITACMPMVEQLIAKLARTFVIATPITELLSQWWETLLKTFCGRHELEDETIYVIVSPVKLVKTFKQILNNVNPLYMDKVKITTMLKFNKEYCFGKHRALEMGSVFLFTSFANIGAKVQEPEHADGFIDLNSKDLAWSRSKLSEAWTNFVSSSPAEADSFNRFMLHRNLVAVATNSEIPIIIDEAHLGGMGLKTQSYSLMTCAKALPATKIKMVFISATMDSKIEDKYLPGQITMCRVSATDLVNYGATLPTFFGTPVQPRLDHVTGERADEINGECLMRYSIVLNKQCFDVKPELQRPQQQDRADFDHTKPHHGCIVLIRCGTQNSCKEAAECLDKVKRSKDGEDSGNPFELIDDEAHWPLTEDQKALRAELLSEMMKPVDWKHVHIHDEFSIGESKDARPLKERLQSYTDTGGIHFCLYPIFMDTGVDCGMITVVIDLAGTKSPSVAKQARGRCCRNATPGEYIKKNGFFVYCNQLLDKRRGQIQGVASGTVRGGRPAKWTFLADCGVEICNNLPGPLIRDGKNLKIANPEFIQSQREIMGRVSDLARDRQLELFRSPAPEVPAVPEVYEISDDSGVPEDPVLPPKAKRARAIPVEQIDLDQSSQGLPLDESPPAEPSAQETVKEYHKEMDLETFLKKRWITSEGRPHLWDEGDQKNILYFLCHIRARKGEISKR